MSRHPSFAPLLTLLAAAALAACGARSSLSVPPPPESGPGGATASSTSASTTAMSSSTAGAGGGCQMFASLPKLTGTVRDFHTSHPDFEKFAGDDPGILESTLGADGEPVYAHPEGTKTTTGEADFNAWFHDTPGVSLSIVNDLPLSPLIEGTTLVGFGFDSETFFPIDNQLFGNEGLEHNFHFTYEAHIHFRFTGQELFTFAGDDDLWAFIDGRVAIDLGGVHGTEGQQITLDSLGLTVGQTYPIDIFFAERHTSQSTLHVELRGFDLCE
jgi:fibro-slime domain-containing protein